MNRRSKDMVALNEGKSEHVVSETFGPLLAAHEAVSKEQENLAEKLMEDCQISRQDAEEIQKRCRETNQKCQDLYEMKIEQVMNLVYNLIEGSVIPEEKIRELEKVLSKEQIEFLKKNIENET